MYKKWTAILTGVCILLTACGQSGGETAVGIAETAGAVLADDAMPIRLQGPLGALMDCKG